MNENKYYKVSTHKKGGVVSSSTSLEDANGQTEKEIELSISFPAKVFDGLRQGQVDALLAEVKKDVALALRNIDIKVPGDE